MQPVVSGALDLGEFDARVLVFGGTYGNLQATEALIAAARAHAIAPQHTICTGDVVAYCADPQATVDRVREWGCAVLMGNCEESLATGSPDCGCGFAADTACAVLSEQWFRLCARDLDEDSRAWMGRLPRGMTFTLGGRRLNVVHGAPSRINRFVFASTPGADMRAEMSLAGGDGIIGGHSGVPFTTIVDGRLWHNSGAIGMPANDGTTRVWYSVLTPHSDGIVITHHALTYDHAAAAARMRDRAYPEGYASALESGMWPSMDVLPPRERAARGRPLSLPATLWTRAEAMAAT